MELVEHRSQFGGVADLVCFIVFVKYFYYLFAGSGMSGRFSRTIYVGNLPSDIREWEVEDLFYKYGSILDIELKIPLRPPCFCFVEFEDPRDAEDAIRGRDGYNFDGCRLRRLSALTNGSNIHICFPAVIVRGLPSSASWQDLKDHMRKAGDVCFAEISRDSDGMTGWDVLISIYSSLFTLSL
ncbi:hypothetical protein Goklo_019299 [Gossypium klotzschianum]|uniref:RRM domain-containing protein n=1 Tax=Gossypium klotzschianum TaxID=34286 RepID=A0A7J8UNF9_9ROSI|nr:hypothetical protein [Gossypium klotzschianum]